MASEGTESFRGMQQSVDILCKAVAIESNQLAQNDHQRGVKGLRPRKYGFWDKIYIG